MFLVGAIFVSCEKRENVIDLSKPNIAGEWITTDNKGNQFVIQLNPDGTATSTWKVLDHGTWKVVEHKNVHIKWYNGVNEYIIVDARGHAQRHTFGPGKPTNGKPDTISEIKKKPESNK